MNYSTMYDLTIPVGGFNQEIISEFMMNLLKKHAPKFEAFLDGRTATAEELQAYADAAGLSLDQLMHNTSMDVDQLLAMFGEFQAAHAPAVVEAPAVEIAAEEVTPVAPAVEVAAEEVTPVVETAPELHAEVEVVADVAAAA